MNMTSSRRFFLQVVPGAIVGLWAARTVAAGQSQGGDVPPANKPTRPVNSPPANPSQLPLPINTRDHSKGDVHNVDPADPKQEMIENQTALQKEVNQLVQLAEELKKEVDQTNSKEVLSVSMLTKTERIQKLAHHIASLAKS
jgi:hypothetical protein